MAARDPYEVLGVARTADDDDIKRAYRKLARELHPDTNPDESAEERFKEVTAAYEILHDPERRRRYDAYGPDGLRNGGAGGADAGAFFGGGLGDLFDAFFGGAAGGGGGGRRGPARGSDVEVGVVLEFEEAVFGASKQVSVRTAVACGTCDGSGASPGTTPTTCLQCAGAGEVRAVRQSILGQMVTARPCPRCKGQGQHIASPCANCRGEGRVLDERSLMVEVPAGVDSGSTLRVQGQGAAGARGASNGDLYVHVEVKSHPRFTRQNFDLIHELHVPVTQAALGAELELETLDGVEPLVLDPGTNTGRVFRLRGRGVPHVGGRGRGDLLVQIVVDTPTRLTVEQERLLRELAAERGEAVVPAGNGLFSKIRSAFK
ncbi:MAG TPA: molecular chaperone DnaJ [Acidimicrobiales bacterium]|nr:molecular chaperone DnaJ [Acidimicrobiales bacterium]